MSATPRVTSIRALEPYILEVRFDDGEARRIDVEPLLFGEMFEPLRDPTLFQTAVLDEELGTVVWANGADLSPEYLYAGDQTASSRSART